VSVSRILLVVAVISPFLLGCEAKNDGSDAVMTKLIKLIDEHTAAIENGLPEDKDVEYEKKWQDVLLYGLAALDITPDARKQAMARNMPAIEAAGKRNDNAKVDRANRRK